MSKRLAILLQPGFATAPWPTDGNGIYEIVDTLSETYFDRREVWMGVRPYNAELARDIKNIQKFNPDYIVHIGHSFGCGVGLINFAMGLEMIGLNITAACLIDPVPKDGFHFFKTEEPFVLPANVQSAIGFRTLNQPSPIYPWGRRIVAGSPGVAIKQVVFGANLADEDSPDYRQIRDAVVDHSNIDNDKRVFEEIYGVIRRVYN